MAGIFISYRRADSDGWTGRLRDTLRAHFGKRVFHDVDNIPDGEIFSDVIDRALQECEVALIIIGPNWANARDEHGRRLDQEEDWVRTEAAMVLSRKIRVIPVLVGGATLPQASELPEELRSITKRQAREIRSTSWDSDVGLLINQLKQILGQRRKPVWLYALPVVVVLAGLAVVAGNRYFGSPTLPGAPKEQTAASPIPAPAHQQAPTRTASNVADSPVVVASSDPKEKPQTVGTGDPPKEKPPPITPPVKAAASPAPPKEAPSSQASTVPQTSAPRSPPGSAISGSVAPARDQPRIARQEPPPAPAKSAEPVQEPGKPAAAQKDAGTGTDGVAVAPVAPRVTPEKVARAAALNLPNRPASARELKIGDNWTYRLREMRFNKSLATVTHEISGGDAGGIRESVRLGGRRAGAEAEGESTGASGATSQRRLVLEPRIFEQQVDRDARLFEFAPFMAGFTELQPGLTWTKISGAGTPDADWRFRGKVSGRERVTVPAGSFDAIKADLEGNLDVSFPTTRDMASETNPSYQTYSVWFVPEVGRAVKYVRRTYNRARVLLDHEQYELVAYQLK